MADLIPWEALDEIIEFFQVLEKLFEEQLADPDLDSEGMGLQNSEISEDSQMVTVKLAIPDEFKDKIDVKIDGAKIEVYGRVEDESVWKSVYHCFSLPRGAAGERASVTLHGNCLQINVPKNK